MSNLDTEKANTRASVLMPDTLAASVAVLFGVAVLQRSVGFGRNVLFCRWLDAEQLGEWDMAFAFLMLAAPVAVFSLPGAFGRYVEHYRRRGQLRAFVRRMLLGVTVLAIAFVGIVVSASTWFSEVIFGRSDRVPLVLLMAAVLFCLIAYNVVVELFTALRLQRVASALTLLNVLGFAAIGAGLLFFYRSAASALLAFGGAAGLTVLVSSFWIWRCWRELPVCGETPAQVSFWSKMLRFTGWLWVTNWLANLFVIADRYMIVHYSGLAPDDALAVVGQYYSARIVPLLLLSVAAMLATVLTPHLARDWEAGRRQAVCNHLNLLWKIIGFGLTAAAVLFLFCAPLLYEIAFAGKFAGGQAVLAWTLMSAIWAGLICIVQIYLMCAEQPRITSMALAIGLPLNVVLNLLLLPTWGLLGAVISTSVSHLVVLTCIVACMAWHGYRLDGGVVLASLLPATLWLGPWASLAALAATVLLAVVSDAVLTQDEKDRLATHRAHVSEKWRLRGERGRVARPATD